MLNFPIIPQFMIVINPVSKELVLSLPIIPSLLQNIIIWEFIEIDFITHAPIADKCFDEVYKEKRIKDEIIEILTNFVCAHLLKIDNTLVRDAR